MKIKISATLDNMPETTDLLAVEERIRQQIAEWLDLDSHPKDMVVVAHKVCPLTCSESDD